MTNVVTVNNGTMWTAAPMKEIIEGIDGGMKWLMLKPSGVVVNLSHVVCISGDTDDAG